MELIVFILGVMSTVAFYWLLYLLFKALGVFFGEETGAKIFGIGFIIFAGLSIILGVILSIQELL